MLSFVVNKYVYFIGLFFYDFIYESVKHKQFCLFLLLIYMLSIVEMKQNK